MNTMSKKILYLKTAHVIPFKTLTEVLSNVLTETTWVFTSADPKDPQKFAGLEIATANPTRSIFTKVRLNGSEFQPYHCKYEKLELGINLENLYKLLKSVDKDDMMSLYVEENDKQSLIIEIENEEKKSKTIYRLKLLDLNQQGKKTAKIDFDIQITMPSTEFHKLCR